MGTYDNRGGHPLHDPAAAADPACAVCGIPTSSCQCEECARCLAAGDPRCADGACPMAAAVFASLTPRERGYVVYMYGSRDDQPNVPDEKNPYIDGSPEHRDWEAGAYAAYLAVIDTEE